MARKAAATPVKEGENIPIEDDSPPPITGDVEVDVSDDPVIEAQVVESEGTTVSPQGDTKLEPSEDPQTLKQRLDAANEATRLANEAAEKATRDLEAATRKQHSDSFRINYDKFTAQYDSLVNAMGSAQEQLASAKRDYRDAFANSDPDAAAEAQEKISRATAQLQALEGRKNQADATKEQWDAYWSNPEEWHRRNPQPQQRQQQPRQEVQQPTQEELRRAAMQQIDQWDGPQRAKEWLRANPEYLTDPVKHNRLRVLDETAQRLTGELHTDAYFAKMEELLGIAPAQQPKPSGNGSARAATDSQPVQQRQSAPVSAPISREAPSMSTGKPVSTRITLNREEQEIAWETRPRPDMTREEANKLYAENKKKYMHGKSNGSIQ